MGRPRTQEGNDRRERIAAARATGLTLQAIARQEGIAVNAVRKYLAAAGPVEAPLAELSEAEPAPRPRSLSALCRSCVRRLAQGIQPDPTCPRCSAMADAPQWLPIIPSAPITPRPAQPPADEPDPTADPQSAVDYHYTKLAAALALRFGEGEEQSSAALAALRRIIARQSA